MISVYVENEIWGKQAEKMSLWLKQVSSIKVNADYVKPNVPNTEERNVKMEG